jgi:hypothetical protein
LTEPPEWEGPWRGRWIWDHEPEEAYWWKSTKGTSHFVYLRRTFVVEDVPTKLFARASCDSRYRLFLNGHAVGRGPVRGEPEFLGWDEYDLAPHLTTGTNVLVALCRYYDKAGPWWLPASPLGTLGRGSFCFETAAGEPIQLVSDTSWRAAPAPWLANRADAMHAFPAEIIDGRRAPTGLNDPATDEDQWPAAVIVTGHGHGTLLDRPPAAPYTTPLRRPIPQLESAWHQPQSLRRLAAARVDLDDDPSTSWSSLRIDQRGDRQVSVWDVGRLCLGHIELVVEASPDAVGSLVDVVVGEDLRADWLPETSPRNWAGRYILAGGVVEQVAFFDPVGFRYIAAHHPPGVAVSVRVEETSYPCPEGASFDCDDRRYVELWNAGARTVAVCSTDAFLDCPGREQRAWIADAYVQILVAQVVNPDPRLIRHHLQLTSRSRLAGGLLAGAAACDFARIGFTMPEYSLHWIRSLASHWRYGGDEAFVRTLLPIADGIIGRYELQRGESDLLEDFPGWVFLDWAQNDRDTVTGAHDALYVAALEDYAGLPGASDVRPLIDRSTTAFEALWDKERHVYVDALGATGPSRRISQHTNAVALLAGIVPEQRVAAIIERIVNPEASLGGRLVITATPADFRSHPDAHDHIPTFQFEAPHDFDPEIDVVAAQPWFCRFLHEALYRHGRRDLILESLLRWHPRHGTLQEFWDAPQGGSSRCHGWSASPTYDLVSTVLGVSPALPGFGRANIDPFLGPLKRASGRVPTPRGWLAVAIENDEVEIDVPDGMVAAVSGCEVSPGISRIPLATTLPRSSS